MEPTYFNVLSEAWAAAYLQALVVLFVFTVGLPPLIFQLRIPPEFYPVVQRPFRLNIAGYCFLLLVVASVLILLLKAPSTAAEPLRGPWATAISAGVLATLLFSASLFVAYLHLLSVSRIIERFENRAYRAISLWKSTRRLERAVDWLKFMGINARAERDRRAILKSLARLMMVAISKERFSVGWLEILIPAYCETAEAEHRASTESAFKRLSLANNRLGEVIHLTQELLMSSTRHKRPLPRDGFCLMVFNVSRLNGASAATSVHQFLWTLLCQDFTSRKRQVQLVRRHLRRRKDDIAEARLRLSDGRQRMLWAIERQIALTNDSKLGRLLASQLSENELSTTFNIGLKCLETSPRFVTHRAILLLAGEPIDPADSALRKAYLFGLAACYTESSPAAQEWVAQKIASRFGEVSEVALELQNARTLLIDRGIFPPADAIGKWLRQLPADKSPIKGSSALASSFTNTKNSDQKP